MCTQLRFYPGGNTDSLTTVAEGTALLFVEQHVKGAIIVHHVTPPHGIKWLLCRMIVRELRQ